VTPAAAPESDPLPGEHFLAEIHEQPDALRALLEHVDEYRATARRIIDRRPSIVRLIGHGSSDAAASFAVYAFGLFPGWTAVRDSISLVVYYGAELDFSDSVVIGLSQSGETPDVVSYVERARRQGALTIALTNEPGSELAHTAETSLPLAAGAERAVAASKTYLNMLAALALLTGECAEREEEMLKHLHRVAELLTRILDAPDGAADAARAFSYVERMYVIGRGMEIATARELALKLKETCRLAAEPLTATDLVHGPVATLDALFPVWVIASRDEGLPAVVDAAARVRAAGATIVASGSAADEIEGAAYTLPVPEAPHPVLAPLLSVVPGQLFAAALARVRGLDADHPVGLTKVTRAR
jgi:glucosamine--fructose-6-phosphate aminotransferase (isomerizing)